MAKSKPDMPMPTSERAKQFSPFSPLRGLSAALAEKEKMHEERRELSDDAAEKINETLLALVPNEIVTAVYYHAPEREYRQLTGRMTKADMFRRFLQIEKTKICFDDIFEIVKEDGQTAGNKRDG